jgi:hypothetical protein
LTDGIKCSVCDETIVATVVIPALGHIDSNPNDYFCDVCNADLCTVHSEQIIEGKAATCTESGLTEGKKCSVCGDIIVKQEVIPALDHKYEATETKPTCTDAGFTTYDCTACGYSYTSDDVDALGHSWTEATCETAKTCDRCKATEGDALGHNWLDATTEAPRTCRICGLTEGDRLPDPTPDEDEKPNNGETPDDGEKDHSECLEEASGWKRFWNSIGNFFRRIFSKYVKCVCGDKLHKDEYSEFKKIFNQKK